MTAILEHATTTVDLDTPLHCDYRREVGDTCPTTATWRARRPCCNVARLFCEECRQRAIARDKTIQFTVDHLGGTSACAACNHRPAPDLLGVRL